MNVRIDKQYLSLQEGFEWNDIPSFAIITGVNGVGKTQLLNILKGRDERNQQLNNICHITDESGHDYKIVISTPESNGQSIVGLIEYIRGSVERSVQKEDMERTIKSWQANIDQWKSQLPNTPDKNERVQRQA